jgi:adenylate cyclase class 2
MLEVEMKFGDVDFAHLEQQLRDGGAHAEPARGDCDSYFNAPDRDFAQTDEALRIRQIGKANFVTYKGPKRDAQTKTRTEIEIPLAEGEQIAEQFAHLLQHLGYRPVRSVKKHRRIFHWERGGYALEVCLDDVAGLGRFAELEIQAPEEQLEPARQVLLETAKALGLTKSERRSYLELLLAKGAE